MSSPDLDADQLRDMPLAILINRRCGHLASICNPTDPAMTAHLERRRVTLAAMGYRGWGVEIRVVTDDEIEGLTAGRRCHRCRLD